MQLARVGAFLGAVTAAVAASVFAATPASAHTPVFTPGCDGEESTLNVLLKDYQTREGKKNTVKVTIDGAVSEDKSFGKDFKETYTKPGDVAHTFLIEVAAWDDPNGEKGWTKDFEGTIPACVQVEVPPSSSSSTPIAPTTTVPTTTVPATTTTTEAAPVTTTSPAAVVPVGEAAPLANTGASIAIPLVIGIVLLGGGVALLVVLRRRAANS